jgi:hypothetical protein
VRIPLATRTATAEAIWLHDLLGPETAPLLGVSRRTVRRWTSATNPNPPSSELTARIHLLALLVDELQYALSPAGIVGVLRSPIVGPVFRGRAPIELLDDEHFPLLLQHTWKIRNG